MENYNIAKHVFFGRGPQKKYIAYAIYRTCDILLLWSPYKKKTCFTKKCLSTSWGSPPHLFYPIFHWFNFWCLHTNAFSYQLSPHKVIELEHKINPLWDLAISNLVLPLMAHFPSLFKNHRSGSLSKILVLLIRSLQKIAIPCHSMMIFKGNKFFTKMIVEWDNIIRFAWVSVTPIRLMQD